MYPFNSDSIWVSETYDLGSIPSKATPREDMLKTARLFFAAQKQLLAGTFKLFVSLHFHKPLVSQCGFLSSVSVGDDYFFCRDYLVVLCQVNEIQSA